MNERIKQLAEQSYQWAVNESKDGPNICAPGSDYFLAMEKKKFAELIVEEMYDFMCKATDNDGAWPSSKEVKQHFGVEE